MARQVVYIDDMTGEAGAEPVTFGWDEVWWELDLTEDNKLKLQEALQPYLDKAHPAEVAHTHEPEPPRRGRRPRGEAAPRAERVDYTADENFGLIHRGKVTEEEAARVRGNIEQANENRARAGQPPIDPNDAKDQKRYGLSDQ